jgi:Zn-dependent protease with chaperone function
MNPPESPSAPLLEFNQLTSSRESRYFPWVVLVAVLLWLAIVVSMIGVFYGVLIGFMVWLGHGLLAAYLRAEGVKVSERQLPELDATFKDVCRQLGVSKIPALYVIQQGGALNAFATRQAGRDFVVVFSDMLEALGPDSNEMRFILGHEVGHLRSGHPLKQSLLAPGLFCPLIGPAYRRAWETSCDRYGAYAAQDSQAAVRAMLVLSGGPKNGPQMDGQAFADQHQDERGFFVSLHELTSSYPTLSRRVTDLLALSTGEKPRSPRRNPLAYLLAMLMPGGTAGAGAPAALMMIVLI